MESAVPLPHYFSLGKKLRRNILDTDPLFHQEVDFAVGPFGVTHLREEVCDFTESMYSENNAIFMVRPTLQTDMAGFVKPFSGMVRLEGVMVVIAVKVFCGGTDDDGDAGIYTKDNDRDVVGMGAGAGELGGGGGGDGDDGDGGGASLRVVVALEPRQGHRLGHKGVHAGR